MAHGEGGAQWYLRKGGQRRPGSLRHFSPQPMILQPGGSQLRASLPSRQCLVMSSDIAITEWGWPLASSGWRPGCYSASYSAQDSTLHPLPPKPFKIYLAPHVNTAEVEKS